MKLRHRIQLVMLTMFNCSGEHPTQRWSLDPVAGGIAHHRCITATCTTYVHVEVNRSAALQLALWVAKLLIGVWSPTRTTAAWLSP